RRYPRMFELEAKGLNLLMNNNKIRVPSVIGTGEAGQTSFILLEHIETGFPDNNFWETFGEELAHLHRETNETFGLDHDNYIGSLPQSNAPTTDWSDFFIAHRLKPQLKLAAAKNLLNSKILNDFEKLFYRLAELFPREVPALLHGDLWSGNFLCDSNQKPVLIDPAVYYGHREMDLAMSKLFGGFSPRFYESYHSAFPHEAGWQERVDLCNLYPLLVHVNLFGGGYVGQLQSSLNRFV
ncbi:MAG TPA: fructosamine kinase family protein, partial [Bacteroidales bacterium]|nr:fructosamine kinase family protein [Bacteroidales bacterium]